MKGIFNMRGVYFFNFKNKKRLPYFFCGSRFLLSLSALLNFTCQLLFFKLYFTASKIRSNTNTAAKTQVTTGISFAFLPAHFAIT